MKHLIALILLPLITLALPLPTMGIRKPAALVQKEFSEITTKILNSIKYIQLYAVQDNTQKMWPLKPEITISNIELKSLALQQALDTTQVTIDFSKADQAIIKPSATNKLAFKADLSFTWTYKLQSMKVYKGTGSAQLITPTGTFEFMLPNNTNKWTGKFDFGTLQMSNLKLEGFYPMGVMYTQLQDILIKKCSQPFNEEVNRYNDIIISYMEYNYFYNNILLPNSTENEEEKYWRNTVDRFYINAENKTIDFAYNGSFYRSMKHDTSSLVSSFDPKYNESQKDVVSITLGYESMKMLLGKVRTIMDEFSMGPEEQKKLFESSLTVGMIGNFYPPILNYYEPQELLIFNCTLKKQPGAVDASYKYTCDFALNKTKDKPILNIPELELATSFTLDRSVEDKTNKSTNIGLSNFRYTSMQLPIRLPIYLVQEFLAFLQPFAGWIGKSLNVDVSIVGKDMNWKYDGLKTDKQVFTTFYYKLE